MKKIYTSIVATLVLAVASTPANAQTQDSGGGPTAFFVTMLGLAAQVAPTILEMRGNRQIARTQASAAIDAARITGQYSYRGVQNQSNAQIRVAQIGARSQQIVSRGEIRGGKRVAQINAGASRYTADAGERSSFVSALFGYNGQVYVANKTSRDAELDRNHRIMEDNRNFALHQREVQSTASFQQAPSRSRTTFRAAMPRVSRPKR